MTYAPEMVARAKQMMAKSLEDLAPLDPAFARAARVLMQKPSPPSPGRPQIDDTNDLLEARHLFESGKAASWSHAFNIVARKYGGDAKHVRAAVERLRRKLRGQKTRTKIY